MAEKPREATVKGTASVDWQLARTQSMTGLVWRLLGLVTLGTAPLRILLFWSDGSSLQDPADITADK